MSDLVLGWLQDAEIKYVYSNFHQHLFVHGLFIHTEVYRDSSVDNEGRTTEFFQYGEEISFPEHTGCLWVPCETQHCADYSVSFVLFH
jgi:hypothetical protein